MIDKEKIRDAAAGRWSEILTRIAGIPGEHLDGEHHPCPKCGGADRFRMIDEKAGAVLCNQCFREECGDGFAAIKWMTGCTFGEALEQVADFVGIELKRKKGKRPDPFKAAKWSSQLCRYLEHAKPGIHEKELLAAGAKQGNHHKETVVALPVLGPSLDPHKPIGLTMFSAMGGGIPLAKTGEILKIKTVKTNKDAKGGFVGSHSAELNKLESSRFVIKTEGPSCMLALQHVIPAELRSSYLVVSNAHGASENPAWMAGKLADFNVVIVADPDEAGEKGAKKWAGIVAVLQREGLTTRIVRMPNAGEDLRDWINAGNTFDDFLHLVENAEVVEADAFPEPFSNFETEITTDENGGEARKTTPKDFTDILLDLSKRTNGWPRRVDRELFVHDREFGIAWLRAYPRTEPSLPYLRSTGNLSITCQHGGVFNGETRTEITQFLATSRSPLATDAAPATTLFPKSQRGPTTSRFEKSGSGDFLCAANGLPMESSAEGIRFGQHVASVLSTVDRSRRVPQVVENMLARIRRAKRDPMELAKRRRSDDQIASGWGKIRARILPIVVSWAPNARCSPMDAALPWAWK